MDEIELELFGGVWRGNVGVYTHETGATYAGARKGAYAHGFGVVTYSYGNTCSGQLANGTWHGHAAFHWANGAVGYDLYEHGRRVHRARVEPNGACFYDNQWCGTNHAGFAKLKAAAQQAGAEAEAEAQVRA